MKNITKGLLVVGIIMFLTNNTNAQAFEKGTINIDLGIGFSLYGTSYSHTESRTATVDPATGLPSSFIDYSRKRDTTDAALSTVIPLSFEYGVASKFGIGFDAVYNNYFISDSDKVDLKSVKAFDFGPKFTFHPLNSDFYDLSFSLGVGFTSIAWDATSTATINDYSGSGYYIGLDIKNKFWFSKHIGMYVNVGYKGNFYPSIDRDTSKEEADLEALPWVSNVTIKDEFAFNMNGVNLGIGLAVKF